MKNKLYCLQYDKFVAKTQNMNPSVGHYENITPSCIDGGDTFPYNRYTAKRMIYYVYDDNRSQSACKV